MTEVVFVGTSDAFGSGGRRQSAVLVRSATGSALLDCGATTNTGLASLGVARDEIDAIFVSHFHGDHFGGIPLLLLAALYEDRRTHPLRIAGPPDVEARVRAVAQALGHPIEHQQWSFPLHFEELVPDVENEVGPFRARAFSTRHSPEANPHGLVVSAGGHRLAYSGDTGWFDALPREVAGSELFVCECTFAKRGYEYHLSLEELAEKRSQFDVGRMLLTHLGAEMRARSGYQGYEVADDGLVLKL